PLLVASRAGNAAVVEALLAAGADVNATTSNGATSLMLASQAGKADAVQALLARGANVDAKEKVKGETALMIAAAYGRADVVRALTAKGADVSVATNVIDMAVFNKEEAERLAQFQQQQAARGGAGAPEGRGRGNPNARGGIDRQYNYTELVGFWGGMTAIHFAAREGQLGAVKALVDAKADVNQRTIGDNSAPMLVATINGHFDVAKYLLEQGADP